MKFLSTFLLLWGISFSASAIDLPMRVDISYEVSTGIGHGELHETLRIKKKDDSLSYHITSEARAIGIMKIVKPGSILRDSRGIVTKRGLRPNHFSDQRGRKRPSIAIFDWEKASLVIRHKGKEKQESLPVGTLDRLSLPYNFMFTPLTGQFFDVHVTDGRLLEQVRYTIEKEILDTPLGKLDTIALTRQRKKDDKLARKIWLATNHHMLPVRIVSTEDDGLEIEKMVTSINLSYTDDE